MPPWSVAGASVPGTTHKRTDMPCQDKLAWREIDDCLVLVLADGAGSAARSSEGARLAVDSAIASVTRELDRQVPLRCSGWLPIMVRVVAAARSALDAAAQGESLRDYATTLTCAVATPRHLVVAQIGDAMVAVQTQTGEMFTFMPPQRPGQFANQTWFITDERALDRVDIRYCPIPVRAVMATTDALLPVAIDPYGEPFHPFWEPIVRRLGRADVGRLPAVTEEVTSLLESERICARVDDDKTLVVAIRTEFTDGASVSRVSAPPATAEDHWSERNEPMKPQRPRHRMNARRARVARRIFALRKRPRSHRGFGWRR